ncbi:metal-dependent hydrolase [Halorussus gelatinilyticus]|uniref:Metal-dependent hydrolase n=1 Tax=Halorussus gelatinilyticus TaxID=2937524 RepID=A0A8U0IHQ3_9EURY|nr:metal-dependent hydrolase [Halorussus gelatinilyticus]UPW00358.1 metal-dependent hydrolase [Halorussus gelatinilyticus]
MMVGHAMIAFAVATALTMRRWPSERALAFGVVAGAFAAMPDVDMLYAVFGLAQVGLAGVWTMTEAFWRSSHLVHRAVTHSLVVGVVAAAAFAAAVAGRDAGDGSASDRRFAAGAFHRLLAVALVAGLVAVSVAESGLLGGAVMVAFLLAGLVVASLAVRWTDFGPRELLAAALLGLLTHPFGDLFTGAPPRFLYPLDLRLVTERVTLLADPTLNLLAVFGVELATIWLAGYVYLRATDRRVLEHVDTRAAFGAAYAIAAVAMPAPTLDVSYHFVFSILAVGAVGVAPTLLPSRSVLSAEWHEAVTWVLTGLSAVSIAALTYTLVYVSVPLF